MKIIMIITLNKLEIVRCFFSARQKRKGKTPAQYSHTNRKFNFFFRLIGQQRHVTHLGRWKMWKPIECRRIIGKSKRLQENNAWAWLLDQRHRDQILIFQQSKFHFICVQAEIVCCLFSVLFIYLYTYFVVILHIYFGTLNMTHEKVQ